MKALPRMNNIANYARLEGFIRGHFRSFEPFGPPNYQITSKLSKPFIKLCRVDFLKILKRMDHSILFAVLVPFQSVDFDGF